MLAAMPSEMLRDYLASVKFEAATPHTLGSAKALLRDIERVRLEGVGYSLEEFTLGISGMGVALLSSSGLPIGGIAISIPCVRYTPEARKRGIAALLHAARQINQLHRATVSPASARPATAAPLRKLSAATSHR